MTEREYRVRWRAEPVSGKHDQPWDKPTTMGALMLWVRHVEDRDDTTVFYAEIYYTEEADGRTPVITRFQNPRAQSAVQPPS
jgi:hypothetical protein